MTKTLIFLLITSVVCQEETPKVKVSHGVLEGTWKESTKGRNFASFEGVPYAKPPIGKDKFKAPQPLEPWTGVYKAAEVLEDCVQFDPFFQQVTGTEDCLHLNVYTPKLKGGSLPVIVFFHGGAFMYGSGGVYSPVHLMDADLVVVTVNYRLGPMGFLSTEDDVVPGNAGLKDQSFALKWVKKNIKKFGGNPDNIVLMGVSAGAASVHYHYLSPMSQGLFSKGIGFSGSAFAPWALSLKPAEKTRQLASNLDCPTDDSQTMVDCLNGKSGEDIAEATIEMFDWKINLFSPFTPTIEPEGTEGAFLTRSPFEATEAGDMEPGPLLLTVTNDEGLYPGAMFVKSPEMLTELNKRWDELASTVFQYNDSIPNGASRDVIAKKIKDHYFDDEAVGEETFDQLIQAIGDRIFKSGTARLAQLHANHGQPVYLGRYSFKGEKSFSNVMTWSIKHYGVAHADDVLHIFKLPFLSSKSAADMKITKMLVRMIHSFASTGVPKLSKDAPQWLPVDADSKKLKFLEISSPTRLRLKTSTNFGHKSFWEKLGLLENKE